MCLSEIRRLVRQKWNLFQNQSTGYSKNCNFGFNRCIYKRTPTSLGSAFLSHVLLKVKVN